jgi:ribosomal protein S18 acetylase RimI-like enzyme
LKIRRALLADDRALAAIDQDTWSGRVTPAPRWAEDRPFFAPGDAPADVFVAELDGEPVGYARLGKKTPLESHAHVLELRSVAVAPKHQRRGAGTQLLEAAIEEARRRGVRRLTLRVLGGNDAARRLYEALGFKVEGVLAEEFLIDGRYVDDVLMGRLL